MSDSVRRFLGKNRVSCFYCAEDTEAVDICEHCGQGVCEDHALIGEQCSAVGNGELECSPFHADASRQLRGTQ